MSELTKEYFYRGLENLGKRLDNLVTNESLAKKLNDQTRELKDYTH
jgi:hypothetical protein